MRCSVVFGTLVGILAAGAPLSASAVVIANPIKHIVVIVQKNRSTDNLFHGFPKTDTAVFDELHDGTKVRLLPEDLGAAGDLNHAHYGHVIDYAGGKMDGFDVANASAPLRPYTYVPRDQIEPYWDLALRYGFADRMFQSNSGPSFPSHLYLLAGQVAGIAENPFDKAMATDHALWSCDAPKGTLAGPYTQA